MLDVAEKNGNVTRMIKWSAAIALFHFVDSNATFRTLATKVRKYFCKVQNFKCSMESSIIGYGSINYRTVSLILRGADELLNDI